MATLTKEKLYRYQTITPHSRLETKFISSSTLNHAKQQLAKQHVLITKIKKVPFHELISSKEQVHHFITQLSLLLEADIPLAAAIKTLAQLEKKPLWQQVLLELQQQLLSGQSLTTAMQHFPMLFSKTTLALIHHGESTGTLKNTLSILSTLLAQQKQQIIKVKKALSYPLFLLLCTLFTSIGIVTFVLPQYQQLFLELNLSLPWITKALLQIHYHLIKHGLLMLTLLIVFSAGLNQLLKRPTNLLIWHKALLKIPLVGNLIQYNVLSLWCNLLAIAYKAYIPLLSALPLANQITNNRHLFNQFTTIANTLKSGSTLHTSLEKTNLFSFIALKMVRISETTGTTGLVFSKIADNYQQQLHTLFRRLTKVAELIALLFLALLVGILITALYLPLMHFGLKGE